MQGVFSKRLPALDRVLIIESGPRAVAEKFIRHLYEVQQSERVDVVTCYGSAPATFDSARGNVFSIHDPEYSGRRGKLISALAQTPYSVISILCTGSPVMMRWKWAIALRTRAKPLIINENADFFFLDWQHRRIVQLMLSHRFGLRDAIRLRTVAELAIVPFSFTYLFCYAATLHLRRFIRLRSGS